MMSGFKSWSSREFYLLKIITYDLSVSQKVKFCDTIQYNTIHLLSQNVYTVAPSLLCVHVHLSSDWERHLWRSKRIIGFGLFVPFIRRHLFLFSMNLLFFLLFLCYPHFGTFLFHVVYIVFLCFTDIQWYLSIAVFFKRLYLFWKASG